MKTNLASEVLLVQFVLHSQALPQHFHCSSTRVVPTFLTVCLDYLILHVR